MKLFLKISVLFVLVAFLFIRANIVENQYPEVVGDSIVSYPADVKTVIDNKCYGCHNPKAKSDKAKQKLLWDSLPALTKMDQINKIDKIIEVLNKGEMPPEKYLQFKPEGKLTDDEATLLKSWAKKTSDKLLN